VPEPFNYLEGAPGTADKCSNANCSFEIQIMHLTRRTVIDTGNIEQFIISSRVIGFFFFIFVLLS
jgi:hypothetical protein